MNKFTKYCPNVWVAVNEFKKKVEIAEELWGERNE